jgi:HAD superfamily hydrolase (TIGR01509 family)
MSKLRAVLFDMDGVLIDSEPVHLAAMQQTLRAHRLPLPSERDWERVFFGRPDRDGLVDWFAEQCVDGRITIEQVMADKLALFATHFDELVRPFADGQWLARRLREHGLRLALVTGARRAEAAMTIERFDLAHLFEAVVSGDDVRTGKPDPEPYVRGAALLGLLPAECLVIEDAPAGVQSGRSAGAAIIAVDRLGEPERFAPLQPVTQLDDGVLRGILSRA